MAPLSISKGLLALTALLSVSCAAPTLSDEDLAHVERIRNSRQGKRQDVKQYLVSWTKSTISVPGGDTGAGDQNINTNGFSIWNEVNDVVYDNANPGNHQPCTIPGDGTKFTLSGGDGCFDYWYFKFQCKAKFSGQPEWCQVFDWEDVDLGWNYGDADIDFYGAFITSSGGCGVVFDVPADVNCGANEPLVTSDRIAG